MRFWFVLILSILGICSNAMAFSLATNKSIFNPGDNIKATISWQGSQSADKGLLFVKVTIPAGKTFFLTPSGLDRNPVAYSELDLSKTGHLDFLSIDYEMDSWFPQGIYTIEALVTQNEQGAINDSSKWLSQGWLGAAFEVTSHYIPLTYPDFDIGTRAIKKVKVQGGLWLIFADHSYQSGLGYELYAMKLSDNGRCLIPPFLVSSTADESTLISNNTYSLFPAQDGGFYLFTIERNGSYSWNLVECMFDSQGNKVFQKVQKSYSSKRPSRLHALFANGRNSWALMAVYDYTLYLYVHDSGGFHEYKVTTEGDFSSPHYYRAFFDKATSRVIIVSAGLSSGIFMRYDLSGQREAFVDITQALSPNGFLAPNLLGWPEEIFKTSQGILLPLPQYSTHPFLLLFLDQDGNVMKSVNVEGVGVSPYGQGKYDIALKDGIIHLIWRQGGGDYNFSSFTLDGTLVHEPTSIFHSYNTEARPLITSLDSHPFMIISHYGNGSGRELKGSFIGYDFPAHQPDLVLSKIHVDQSPAPYAVLGSDTTIKVTVFNRGETTSPSCQLKATYLGNDYAATVPALSPGEGRLVSFQVSQPQFLTSAPDLSLNLDAEDWKPNNSVNTRVFFGPMTPIYPAGSSLYQWTILDASDNHAISHARITYDLSNISTVSGSSGTVTLVAKSDYDGRFSTVLPDGTYRFTITKTGYPKTIISFSAPVSDTTIFLEPPGDLSLSFSGSDGQGLHPAPQKVHVALEHNQDQGLPDWQEYKYDAWGTESGVTIHSLMPGNYTGHVFAFGYETKEFQVTVTGGQHNQKALTLNPLPRGTVTGRILSSGSPVSGASIRIKGLSIETTSGSNGTFEIDDLPKDSEKDYVLRIRKQDFQAKDLVFHVVSDTNDLGDIELKHIYSKKYQVSQCRYAALAQDVEWAIGDSYEIKTLYGVWQLGGALHYKQLQGSSDLDIDQLDLDYVPFYWNYTQLDGHIVDSLFSWALGAAGEVSQVANYISDAWDAWDWGESGQNAMITYDNLSDPLGTVQGGVVDCGDPDALDLDQPDSSTPKADITVIRIDDVRIYEENGGLPVELFSSFSEGRYQYYSDDFDGGHINIPVHLSQAVHGPDKLLVRVYMRVMNGLYDSGPLALVDTDRIYVEFRVKDGKLVFNGLMPNPDDYPDFGD